MGVVRTVDVSMCLGPEAGAGKRRYGQLAHLQLYSYRKTKIHSQVYIYTWRWPTNDVRYLRRFAALGPPCFSIQLGMQTCRTYPTLSGLNDRVARETWRPFVQFVVSSHSSRCHLRLFRWPRARRWNGCCCCHHSSFFFQPTRPC